MKHLKRLFVGLIFLVILCGFLWLLWQWDILMVTCPRVALSLMIIPAAYTIGFALIKGNEDKCS